MQFSKTVEYLWGTAIGLAALTVFVTARNSPQLTSTVFSGATGFFGQLMKPVQG